jgi:hypothetical protein
MPAYCAGALAADSADDATAVADALAENNSQAESTQIATSNAVLP